MLVYLLENTKQIKNYINQFQADVAKYIDVANTIKLYTNEIVCIKQLPDIITIVVYFQTVTLWPIFNMIVLESLIRLLHAINPVHCYAHN